MHLEEVTRRACNYLTEGSLTKNLQFHAEHYVVDFRRKQPITNVRHDSHGKDESLGRTRCSSAAFNKNQLHLFYRPRIESPLHPTMLTYILN